MKDDTMNDTTPIDAQTYYAVAVLPKSSVWRTPMLTLDNALAKADRFVKQWQEVGLKAEVCIFYRDGSLHGKVSV